MTENLSGVSTFTEEQVKILAARGITPEVAHNAGVMGVQDVADLPPGMPDYWTRELGYLPGLLFRWDSPVTGAVEWQLRPDTAVASSDGSVRKYVFRKDAPSILHRAWYIEDTQKVVITEGTCQTIAAAAYAPDGWSVYGIAGCQSWTKRGVPSADLAVVEGRTVLVVLDADAATNRNVYDAGVALREACLAEGATSVRFVRIPGGKKSGLDDVLAGQPEERRTAYLGRLFDRWLEAPPKDKPEAPAATKPKPKKTDTAGDPDADGGSSSPGSAFFGPDGLRVEALADAVQDNTPVALTAENKIAVYGGGVYRLNPLAFSAAVGALLGDLFRSAHRGNVEEYLAGRLMATGTILPDRPTRPYMNVLNGMVDLRTGKLRKHDPRYMSSVQFPVTWDPDAQCPRYEAWVRTQAGDQVDVLEETVAFMLDPSNTPQRAAFLFGKAGSGKGTFLRILSAIAGPENTSGVDLARLATDRFAAANVYGKVLNVSGDLPAMHVDDVSMFKKLTGQDLISADRKYGGQFTFTNRALFVFAGNELPTVGESSRAYIRRIRPIQFDASFEGSEDPSIEAAMMAELPGILARWVRAWQRRVERGWDLPIDPRVASRFEVASDRVRQFLADRCETGEGFMTTTDLYTAFKTWAADQGGAVLGRTKFAARVRSSGVSSSVNAKKTRGWLVRLLPTEQWDQDHDQHVSEGGGTDGHESTQDTGSGGAELHNLPIPAEFQTNTMFEGPEEYNASPIRQGRNNSATVHHPAPESAIDRVFTKMYTHGDSNCVDCGTELALVDRTWFACPRCHPASVRTELTDPTEENR